MPTFKTFDEKLPRGVKPKVAQLTSITPIICTVTELALVMLFGDFGKKKGEEVADPYYGGISGFETNFKQVVS